MYYYLKNVLMYLHSTVLCRENGVLHYYYHQICKGAPLWTKGTDRIPNHSTDLSAVGTRKGNIFKREGRKRVANRMPREAVRQRHHKSHPSIHPGAGGRCVRRAAPCSASSAHNSPHARTRRRRRSRFSFSFFSHERRAGLGRCRPLWVQRHCLPADLIHHGHHHLLRPRLHRLSLKVSPASLSVVSVPCERRCRRAEVRQSRGTEG